METVHESDLDWRVTDRDGFGFRRKQLGAAADGTDLGCSLYEIPPGTRPWPYHYHAANEEAVYVLSGEGELRGPDDVRRPLAPGTYASFPTGPEGAHAIENTGDEPLRYLAVSTMCDPEVATFPDSEKVRVMAGAPPGGDSDQRTVDASYPRDAAVDYWSGEE